MRRLTTYFALTLLLLASNGLLGQGGTLPFIRGDANFDAEVNISDAVTTLGILFLGDPDTTCKDSMDSNDDGETNISDATFTLNFLFNSGDDIPAPYPGCEADPTADGLDCQDYPQEKAGCPSGVECLDTEALNELVGENVPPIVCVPPDATELEALGLTITICPAENAPADCGETGEPGCPVVIESLEATLDAENELAFVAIEGAARDLPILLEGLSAVLCNTQIPFSGVAKLELELDEVAPGAVEILDVLQVSLDQIEVGLEAEGGILCDLLAGSADLFAEQLRAEIENVADDLLADLQTELEGVILCAE